MQALYSREEMQEVDRRAVGEQGVSEAELMQNAGRGAGEVIRERFADQLAHVVLIGGEGNNGGDAWVVAQCLSKSGARPHAILIGDEGALRGAALQYWNALDNTNVNVEVLPLERVTELSERLREATLLVDGLFGTGLSRTVEGAHAEAIRAMNQSGMPIVSLDIPSGINANTGQVLGAAIKATLTVTFAGQKRGLHQFPGVELAGEIVQKGIGVEPAVYPKARLLEAEDLQTLAPAREPNSHKGKHGHLLIIGGSEGKTGAPILSALGAFRAGAGLVSVASHAEIFQLLEREAIEVMTEALPLVPKQETLQTLCQNRDALVVGPGFGTEMNSQAWVIALAEYAPIPCILDADALNILAEAGIAKLRKASAPRIITPHPGEAARLLNTTTEKIQSDRYAAAQELCEISKAIVVLKGARTIIASAEQGISVCTRGTPALATAGTGDVLAGMIGAFAMRVDPYQASCAGTLFHALRGEAVEAQLNGLGLLARELAQK